MNIINLKLNKIQSYNDFKIDSNSDHVCGVYIWGFQFQGKDGPFLPYYVGKHEKSIKVRIEQHIESLQSGTHKIISKEYLDQYNTFDSEKGENTKYLFSEVKKAKSKLEDEKRVDLQPHIDYYITNFSLTFLNCLEINDEKSRIDFIAFLEQQVKAFLLPKFPRVNGRIGKNRLGHDIGFGIDNIIDSKEKHYLF